ncbi:putative lanosterol 14-alpha-demethylase [Phaeomoniella chlamydospora]|uniref:sterol 14alpha-demethylase n=1 Tax=Phaeomoniella chlamydospora TaxID=158046 RepID=A0A0G2G0B5_PHACM|nr:putative lanosterol 14-alpha-demethylase [Phaeomoniella chlamydospora]
MGLSTTLLGPLEGFVASQPLSVVIPTGFAAFVVVAIILNVLSQVLFKNPNEPPIVFHWVPIIGSTVTYGIDPFKFFFACREKYGDVFTFILLGQKTTVCLGTKGNEFILNGKLKDLNAEEVYTRLTTPVFGRDVVYDCPNSKLMEQKKFVKFGLTSEALRSHVLLITQETLSFLNNKPALAKQTGTIDICPTMAELTIYTASRSLQGKEVREKFDASFADLYHDLDMGFSPINFMLPWAPFPHNKKRDAAREKMVETYTAIIKARRDAGNVKTEEDMIWNLMSCQYKDGKNIPDHEVAHMMIALLMAGQHSSSATSAWILLRLATRPDIQEELFEEQKKVLGEDLPPVTYDGLQKLTLNSNVVKETLRLHAPIHSIMRQVKSPMAITAETNDKHGRQYVVPPSHRLLSAPGFTSRLDSYFPEAMTWEPHRWEEGHRLAYTGGEVKEEQYDYGYGMVSKGAQSPYLPFGAGRHRCIGEQFAYVQLGTIVANLVRVMKLSTVDGSQKVVETDYSSLFSRPMSPALVRFERRKE